MAVQTATTTTTESTARPEKQNLLWILRAISTLQLLSLIFQAVAAGEMMGGASWGGSLHGTGALFVHVSGALLLITAVLYWRPGPGLGWAGLAIAGQCGDLVGRFRPEHHGRLGQSRRPRPAGRRAGHLGDLARWLVLVAAPFADSGA